MLGATRGGRVNEARGTLLSNRAGDAACRLAAERAKADLWQEVAGELAEALEVAHQCADRVLPEAYAALRRYEKARDE